LLFLTVLPLYLLTLDLKLGFSHSEELVGIGRVIREQVPQDACFLPFEPKWGLVADRLPQAHDGRPALVDVYVDMLLATEHSGLRFPHAQQALQAPAAQERVRWMLDGCDYLSFGWRRNMLGESTLHWTRERYMRKAEVGGVDLWQRRQ
jgi:hypothetical protein